MIRERDYESNEPLLIGTQIDREQGDVSLRQIPLPRTAKRGTLGAREMGNIFGSNRVFKS
jgi:hypothetical protein